MATLMYGMHQSLDGFVDHDAFRPDPELFDHFIRHTHQIKGSIYGRRLYELMHYWDEDQPEWTAAEHEFAEGWRRIPKWVISTTLTEVGPNATLISQDIEPFIRQLKQSIEGEIEVGGTVLARHLSELGLIDEYRIYLQPVVLGKGTPYFNGFRPRLRLKDSERIGDRAIRLSYVPDSA